MRRWWLGCLAAAAASCPQARAQDVLYGVQPPKGAAFVRFVNATEAPVEVRPDFAPALTLGTVGADRVAPYAVVGKVAGRSLAAGFQAGAASGRQALALAPGSYTTVIVVRSGERALEAMAVADQAEFDQSRARLSFYNAVPGCAAAGLAVIPSGAAVFTGVAPGAVQSRSVSPVKAAVRASCADARGADAALDRLEAGTSFSVWMVAAGPAVVAFATKDASSPYNP